MRSKISKWLWGLCFVAAGALLILKQQNVVPFSMFFPGWWTLFIIVPCLISVVQSGFNVGNSIGIGVGTILLLRYYFPDVVTTAWIFPVILIIIGLGIIFKRPFQRNWKPPAGCAAGTPVSPDVSAIFSGQNVRPVGEKYAGGTFSAVFGGVEIDLRSAILEPEVHIQASAIFGGVEIFLPEACKVVTGGTHVFGGITNKHLNSVLPDVPTVYLDITCIFGGAEIH